MKLERMLVRELFGSYNYQINFKLNEMVTILHAPNGFGKTTVLKLIKAIIEGDIVFLDETPFKEVILQFDNGDKIQVTKDRTFESFLETDIRRIRNQVVPLYTPITLPLHYEIYSYILDEVELPKNEFDISINKDVLLSMLRRYPTRYIESQEQNAINVMTLKDILMRDYLDNEIFEYGELGEILIKYKELLHIHIIEANRLFKQQLHNEIPGKERYKEKLAMRDSIKVYSEELKGLIAEVREEFGNKSENLDRTFPNRVLDMIINNKGQQALTEEQIRHSLMELECERKNLENLGLINTSNPTNIPENLEISVDTKRFLTLYIQDNKSKLAVYNTIKAKIDLLLEIINYKNEFSNKKMKIDRDRGVVFELNNKIDIPLEKLSSGEKNDFILFYELIFKASKKSIILIDEPEISLHIAWQQEFVKELLKICEMNDMQAIIATHSPNIVDEYWELLVDMEEN